jgi:hypothetical protein
MNAKAFMLELSGYIAHAEYSEPVVYTIGF